MTPPIVARTDVIASQTVLGSTIRASQGSASLATWQAVQLLALAVAVGVEVAGMAPPVLETVSAAGADVTIGVPLGDATSSRYSYWPTLSEGARTVPVVALIRPMLCQGRPAPISWR